MGVVAKNIFFERKTRKKTRVYLFFSFFNSQRFYPKSVNNFRKKNERNITPKYGMRKKGEM